MKKVILLMMISILFTSCGNNETKIEEEVKNNVPVQNEIIKDETPNTEIPAIIEEENQGEIEEKTEIIEESANIVEKNETIINNGEDTTVSNDNDISEAELEAEVNNLLDEFIDSLDSYDK